MNYSIQGQIFADKKNVYKYLVYTTKHYEHAMFLFKSMLFPSPWNYYFWKCGKMWHWNIMLSVRVVCMTLTMYGFFLYLWIVLNFLSNWHNEDANQNTNVLKTKFWLSGVGGFLWPKKEKSNLILHFCKNLKWLCNRDYEFEL